MEDGTYSETVSGTPQGGVISPLLSNIYLHFLDTVWQRQCAGIGKLVRYADDFVILCRSREAVEEAERRVRIIFERLKQTLHPEKTRRVDLTEGKEGFDFLGCHLHMRDVGEAVGGKADSSLLPSAVALEAKHEARADEGEGVDRLTTQRSEGRGKCSSAT